MYVEAGNSPYIYTAPLPCFPRSLHPHNSIVKATGHFPIPFSPWTTCSSLRSSHIYNIAQPSTGSTRGFFFYNTQTRTIFIYIYITHFVGIPFEPLPHIHTHIRTVHSSTLVSVDSHPHEKNPPKPKLDCKKTNQPTCRPHSPRSSSSSPSPV